MNFGTKSSILLASSASICVVAMPTPAAAQTRSFDVPAQPAETGIPALGRQAEIQIAAARRFTKGLRTNEVRGTMTVKEALSKLLAGTGLTVRSTRSEEHTSELQSLMRISYADFCLKKT